MIRAWLKNMAKTARRNIVAIKARRGQECEEKRSMLRGDMVVLVACLIIAPLLSLFCFYASLMLYELARLNFCHERQC